MAFSEASTEDLENILELPRQKLLTEKRIITKRWLNQSGSGSCFLSKVQEIFDLTKALPALPCKNPNVHIAAPGDAMQFNLVPSLPQSVGFENNVTTIDLFSRYLFAYMTSKQDAKTNAKVINNVNTKHA